MPTKRPNSPSKTEPLLRFYLAEDLRQEINGKITAVGLYPDCVVVLQAPAEAPDPTESQPILIKSLGFLFNISNLFENATISVDIRRNGKIIPFVTPMKYQAPKPGRSINLVGVMQPCPITSLGIKELIVKIGDRNLTVSFEIRKEIIASKKNVLSSKIKNPRSKRQKKKKL